MRTTINLNDKLLEEVVCMTGEKDKGRAVNKAMEEYVRRQKIDKLLAARGTFPDLVDKTAEWEEEELRLEREHKRNRNW